MSNIVVTIKKELRSMLRDKKTLVTLFVYPLFIPLIIFLYGYMFDDMEDASYLVGINYEVNDTERSLLDEIGLEVEKFNNISDMKDAYNKGDILGYIDYNEKNNCYSIYANPDSTYGGMVMQGIYGYLDGYNNYLKDIYLIGEDVDIEKANNNFEIKEIKLDGENYVLDMIFTMAFTYIIMAIVMSSTSMATSATAVEKENGTMETLLTFPIKIKDLIIGKYIATTIMGFVSSLVGLLLAIISLIVAINSFESFKELVFSFGSKEIFFSILIIFLASLFIAGVSILLVSRTKTFKEAQSVSSAFSIISLVPMMVSFMNVSINNLYYLIPILGHTQILMDIFSGIISYTNIISVILSSVFFVIIVIWLVIKKYKIEEVLF